MADIRAEIRGVVVDIEKARGAMAGLYAARCAAALVHNGLLAGDSPDVAERQALARLKALRASMVRA